MKLPATHGVWVEVTSAVHSRSPRARSKAAISPLAPATITRPSAITGSATMSEMAPIASVRRGRSTVSFHIGWPRIQRQRHDLAGGVSGDHDLVGRRRRCAAQHARLLEQAGMLPENVAGSAVEGIELAVVGRHQHLAGDQRRCRPHRRLQLPPPDLLAAAGVEPEDHAVAETR